MNRNWLLWVILGALIILVMGFGYIQGEASIPQETCPDGGDWVVDEIPDVGFGQEGFCKKKEPTPTNTPENTPEPTETLEPTPTETRVPEVTPTPTEEVGVCEKTTIGYLFYYRLSDGKTTSFASWQQKPDGTWYPPTQPILLDCLGEVPEMLPMGREITKDCNGNVNVQVFSCTGTAPCEDVYK